MALTTRKVAFVGGASKGLGKGCAIELAKKGIHLALCARNLESLKQTAAEISKDYNVEVLPIATDLSNIQNVRTASQTAIEHFGHIDILVTNSGGPKPGSFFDLKEEDWISAYNSILYYVIELYRSIIPQMKARKWGRIINITSLTVKEPSPTLVLSNVFRTGVVSLAKTLSKELIENGITINNVCPGPFKTDRAIQLMKTKAENLNIDIAQVELDTVKNLPLKRMYEPEELGSLVAFLASEEARVITGTTIQVDGGISSGLL